MPTGSSPTHAGSDSTAPGYRWLIAAGYATWLACGILPLTDVVVGRWALTRSVSWISAYVAFGLAFALFHRSDRRPAAATHRPELLLVMQSVAGLACTFLSGRGSTAAMLVVTAAQLPHLLPLRTATVWIAAQTIAIAAIFAQYGWTAGVTAGIGFGGFQLFAVASAYLAESEHAARQALGRANLELVANRARLAETSRNEERLRIARDLHDVLGHQLTALSLQLDVASRLGTGGGAAHLAEARAIAALLLGNVRQVVGRLREAPEMDFPTAIRALAAATPGLEIHLALPEALPREAGTLLTVFVRAVEEILTNCVRHSAARNLWIDITPEIGGLSLQARDDGHGVAALVLGHGLTGMRERFEACEGRVEFHSSLAGGFAVRGFIPLPKARA